MMLTAPAGSDSEAADGRVTPRMSELLSSGTFNTSRISGDAAPLTGSSGASSSHALATDVAGAQGLASDRSSVGQADGNVGVRGLTLEAVKQRLQGSAPFANPAAVRHMIRTARMLAHLSREHKLSALRDKVGAQDPLPTWQCCNTSPAFCHHYCGLPRQHGRASELSILMHL